MRETSDGKVQQNHSHLHLREQRVKMLNYHKMWRAPTLSGKRLMFLKLFRGVNWQNNKIIERFFC